MASDEEFVIPAKDVPRDPEGFVQAFAPDDADGIREFFAEFGFVVVRDVYTAQQCAETIDDIWAKIEDMTRGEAQRGDESTWDRNTWRYTGIPQEGMIGGSSLWTRRIILNRQTPALHRAFATVLGNEDLLVNHDRYGMFRPAKGKQDRKTMLNLHLDMNPWEYIEGQTNDDQIAQLSKLRYRSSVDWIVENNEVGVARVGELHVQGMVNLADNREEDGGFWLVPGFRDVMPEWAAKRAGLREHFGTQSRFIVLPQERERQAYQIGVRVTSRAGSAILWDQRTLHGSKPNDSNNARYAQFYKMFPRVHPAMTAERAEKRRAALLSKLKAAQIDPQSDLTPLGRRVFGLERDGDAEEEGGSSAAAAVSLQRPLESLKNEDNAAQSPDDLPSPYISKGLTKH